MSNSNTKTKLSVKIVKSFLSPWSIIKKKPLAFILFFLFTIFAGQIGIIINLITRLHSGKFNFYQSVYLDSASGSFYTYSIALIASSLGPLFVNFAEKSPTEFRSIKILTISISIFVLFFAGVLYSVTTVNPDPSTINSENFIIDLPQFILFVFAILIATYIFNVLELENFKEDFPCINDENYAEKEDDEIDNLSKSANNLSNDNKGNKL